MILLLGKRMFFAPFVAVATEAAERRVQGCADQGLGPSGLAPRLRALVKCLFLAATVTGVGCITA